jgi:hypothetical protein
MKTTVEISDELFKRSQQLAKRKGMTLRALLEEGLRLVIKTHHAPRSNEFKFPTFGRDGVNEEFRDSDWNKIRDTIYRDGERGER